jgi:hypothetical protein
MFFFFFLRSSSGVMKKRVRKFFAVRETMAEH